jgi:hypothetical protein
MAALDTFYPTLLDLGKRLDPNGYVDTIAEVLDTQKPILKYAPWYPANEGTSHRTTIRTGIPLPIFRKLYGGVKPSKSTTMQVRDTLGFMENLAEVDAKMIEINGNTAAFRLSEEMSIVEGFGQLLEQTIIYGNEGTQQEAFHGLYPRFNSTVAPNGENIIVASSVTDGSLCRSMWLIGFGEKTVHMLYPRGTKAGLQITDYGKVITENIDGDNGRAAIYRSHYQWDCGLTVRDWRYVVRVARIHGLTKNAATGTDLIDAMTDAVERPPGGAGSGNGVRWVFLCDRRTKTFLRKQIRAGVQNSSLTMEQIAGRRVMMFDGIPVEQCDILGTNEPANALVTA